MGLLILASAFLITFLLARRSVGLGMSCVCWIGGVFGIVRANNLDTLTYFMFDASIVAIYLALLPNIKTPTLQISKVRKLTLAIILWPIVYLGLGFLFPQHPLIQLLGLRAAIWFVPFVLIGTQMTRRDIVILTWAIAGLNIFAFIFALAEYSLGVQTFYPRNSVTEIIYNSNDVAGFTELRIPATFSSSAAYGGYLVAGFPLIISRFAQRGIKIGERLLLILALLAAMLGVFICASRSPVIGLTAMLIGAGFFLRHRPEIVLAMVLVVAFVVYQVAADERLQRVSSLADTEATTDRVQMSANVGILGVVADYPLGVGLGGAYGTSIPSFLSEYSIAQVGAENELSRIALEQSFVGIALWLAFVVWIVRFRFTHRNNLILRMATLYIAYSWLFCFIGTGLLVGIPVTAMLLCYMGFASSAEIVETKRDSKLPISDRRVPTT